MKTKNKYHYPVKLDKNTVMTSSKSKAHVGRLRYAVDFIVPVETPIKASLSGIVVDVKQNSNSGGTDKKYDKHGNYIEIRHKNKEYSIYEHIKKNRVLVKVGEKIKAGQIIGYSGKTGWLANLGPHLHFDVHKYHKPFGPEDYKTLKICWKSLE